jgi:hypothetical protein
VDPNPRTGILIRREKKRFGDIEAHSVEGHVMTETEAGRTQLQGKECQRLPEAIRS